MKKYVAIKKISSISISLLLLAQVYTAHGMKPDYFRKSPESKTQEKLNHDELPETYGANSTPVAQLTFVARKVKDNDDMNRKNEQDKNRMILNDKQKNIKKISKDVFFNNAITIDRINVVEATPLPVDQVTFKDSEKNTVTRNGEVVPLDSAYNIPNQGSSIISQVGNALYHTPGMIAKTIGLSKDGQIMTNTGNYLKNIFELPAREITDQKEFNRLKISMDADENTKHKKIENSDIYIAPNGSILTITPDSSGHITTYNEPKNHYKVTVSKPNRLDTLPNVTARSLDITNLNDPQNFMGSQAERNILEKEVLNKEQKDPSDPPFDVNDTYTITLETIPNKGKIIRTVYNNKKVFTNPEIAQLPTNNLNFHYKDTFIPVETLWNLPARTPKNVYNLPGNLARLSNLSEDGKIITGKSNSLRSMVNNIWSSSKQEKDTSSNPVDTKKDQPISTLTNTQPSSGKINSNNKLLFVTENNKYFIAVPKNKENTDFTLIPVIREDNGEWKTISDELTAAGKDTVTGPLKDSNIQSSDKNKVSSASNSSAGAGTTKKISFMNDNGEKESHEYISISRDSERKITSFTDPNNNVWVRQAKGNFLISANPVAEISTTADASQAPKRRLAPQSSIKMTGPKSSDVNNNTPVVSFNSNNELIIDGTPAGFRTENAYQKRYILGNRLITLKGKNDIKTLLLNNDGSLNATTNDNAIYYLPSTSSGENEWQKI